MTAVPESLERLLQRRAVWRGGAPAGADGNTLSSGFPLLDRVLPGGGWPTGALTDIHAVSCGAGEMQLVLPALAGRPAAAAPRMIVWLNPPHVPFAPALESAGIDLGSVVVVRTQARHELLWAAEQVLRAAASRALLAWVPEIRYPELRRLAVAAENGRSLVALFRPLQAAREASPAGLRLRLEPSPTGLGIHLFKRRGAFPAPPVMLPVDRPPHAMAGPAFPSPRTGPALARACPVRTG